MAEAKFLNLEKIVNTLGEHTEELGEKYGVEEVRLFGSYARRKHRKRDVYIPIEF